MSEGHRFEQRLLLKAARAIHKPADLSALTKAIDKAVMLRDYVDYNKIPAYVRGVREAADTLTDSLNDGMASDVRTLSEYFLERLAKAADFVDDSDGRLGGVWQVVHGLHEKAALQSPPDRTRWRHGFWRGNSPRTGT